MQVQAILCLPDCLLKSSNRNGRSSNGSSESLLSSLSLLGFGFSSTILHSVLLVVCSSLRSNTELEDELEAALFPEAWPASGLHDSCGSAM